MRILIIRVKVLGVFSSGVLMLALLAVFLFRIWYHMAGSLWTWVLLAAASMLGCMQALVLLSTAKSPTDNDRPGPFLVTRAGGK